MKLYTDIKQSKKLAEILPIESADMWFANGIVVARNSIEEPEQLNKVFPCWSLAALLNILRQVLSFTLDVTTNGNSLLIVSPVTSLETVKCTSDDTLDVVFDMLIKLKEKGLI